jgi:hypothetical protein
MPTIKELHQVYLSKLETTLQESGLLLQKQESGLNGELKTSGSICEQFVRQTLQRFIVPGQFRLTTGFIATPDLLRGEANLPQCDILIVAKNAPSLLKLEDSGIEVVPYESVSGIIEVKRTLTEDNIWTRTRKEGALNHLASIIASVGRSSDLKTDKVLNMANAAVMLHNHSSDKPLLGVIALRSDVKDMTEVRDAITGSDSLVDFVWTLDGHALLPGIQNLGEANFYFYTHTARPETRTWAKLATSDFQSASSPFYRMFLGTPRWYYLGKLASQAENTILFDRSQVFARIIGVLSLMLSRICTRALAEQQMNDYFLRPV